MMKELSKEETKNRKFYKILPSNLKCNDYQYHEGLNIDTREFNHFEYQNGLHFADINSIMYFCDYGIMIAEVEVPEDEVVLFNTVNGITKYKSHSIILKNIRDLWDLNTLDELIEEGVNININDDYILRIATQDNQLDMVKYLVNKGCDVHANNNICISYAVANDNLDMVKYLVEEGITITQYSSAWILQDAITNNNLDMVKYLVENGIDITVDNNIALKRACAYGYLDIIKYIIEKINDINSCSNA